jgi:hypothetical protein
MYKKYISDMLEIDVYLSTSSGISPWTSAAAGAPLQDSTSAVILVTLLGSLLENKRVFFAIST